MTNARRTLDTARRLWYEPTALLLRSVSDHDLINEELTQWAKVREVTDAADQADLMVTLMVTYPEFRNVFYYRLRQSGGTGEALAMAASRIWRPIPTLDIATPHIGPGLVISHGNGTILTAESIGRNCWVHHEVTIGWEYGTGKPTIGNDVFVGVGAKILGSVNVGDGARIGANAVVVDDVPVGGTAVGVPARIRES